MPERDPIGLYVSDGEIAALLGIGETKWKANAQVLEHEGLPRRDPLFCHRRYWPAVKAFFDRRNGIGSDYAPRQPDGEENWDEQFPKRNRGARS